MRSITYKTYKEIINSWNNIDGFARQMGVKVSKATQWRARNVIPARYWEQLIDLSKKEKLGITLENLARIEALRKF